MAIGAMASPQVPINEFIVKVASRCNLDCDYCYEYHAGDHSWKTMPKFMSDSTCDYLAFRIAEHAREFSLSHVFITFHGGEPTLAGSKRLSKYCDSFLTAARDDFEVTFSMQTNATLVDQALCDLIRMKRISVSVSIDGGEATNDLHRLDHRGKSSFATARNGIALLQNEIGDLLTGLLAVVDVRTNPIQVFDELAELSIKSIELLLPHHDWEKPPLRPGGDSIAYGRWYFEVFKEWVRGRHPTTDIRFFKNILSQMLGRGGIYEAMNLAPATLLTVNSAGGYEGVDCIKSTGSGAQNLGLAARDTKVSDVLSHPSIEIRQSGEGQLAEACLGCAHKNICGGGYFPHRYSLSHGFHNRSVYCDDLYWLIEQIGSHIKLGLRNGARNI